MRVAIIGHSYLVRENRKNLVELAKYAIVKVISPDSALHDSILGSIDLPKGDDAHHFSLHSLTRIYGSQYLLNSITLSFDSFKPDIIHVEYDPWALIFWQTLYCMTRYAKNAKVVITSHKNTYRKYRGPGGWIKNAIARSGLRHVQHIIAVSEKAALMYVRTFGVPRRKITVCQHLGTDVSLFAPNPDRRWERGKENFVIGYCGLLEAHKGISDLLTAVEQCRSATGANLTVKCLGEGRLRETLQAQARHTEWLYVLPAVPHAEVAGFLNEIDIFVLPSRVLPDHEEHDAHALVEALSTGIPSIGTRSGIIPEILGDGTGLLAEPGSPGSLAAALATLVGNEALRHRLGRLGRKKAVNEFSLEAIARRYMLVYEHTLHEQ